MDDIQKAALFRLDLDHTKVLLYQLKNAIVDENWVVVEAILAIFLRNDMTPVARTILAHSVVREFGMLGPGLSDKEEEKKVLKRCEKYAVVMLLRLRRF